VAYVDDSAKSSLADHGDTSYAAAMFESQELAGASAAERQALLGDAPDTKVPQARAVAREMPSERIDLKEHLKEIEVDFIKRSLSANKGNVTVAAEHLGLRRTTLIEKIKKYGIEYRSACPA
jgi:sigma-54 specific flagellar transcriptional regulator A